MIFTAAGIELTSSGLRVAVVRGLLNKPKVIHSSVIEHFLDLSVEKRKEALASLAKKVSAKRYPVFLSLPREDGIIRQLQLPIEAVKNAKSVVALQVEAQSPWEVGEIYWDFVIEKPTKATKLLNVTVVIIPTHILDPWMDFFRSAGLPLTGASLSPLAWVHSAAIMHQGPAAPFIVLGGDPQQVHGFLIQGGRLTAATVDNQDSVPALIEVAKQRLCALGHVNSSDKPFFYCHNLLAEALSKAGDTAGTSPVGDQVFSGEMAAALVGLKKGSFRTNLVPPEMRYRRGRVAFVAACLSVALSALVGLGLLLRPGYQNLRYLPEVQGEIDKIAPAVKQVARDETDLNALNTRYVAVSRIVQDQDQNLEALRELAVALPASTWLTNYSFQGGTVTVSGISATASGVRKALEEDPTFKDIQFVSAITKDAEGRERFTIRAAIGK